MANENNGTPPQGWAQEILDHINQAVHDEAQRTLVAAKCLPFHLAMTEAAVVPADVANVNQQPLTVDEIKMVDFVEIMVEMALTKNQFTKESVLKTLENLATRATNLLSQAEDLLIFQGDQVVLQDPLFTSNKVSKVSGSAGSGLLGSLTADQIVSVSPTAIVDGKPTWGGTHLQRLLRGMLVCKTRDITVPTTLCFILSLTPIPMRHCQRR